MKASQHVIGFVAVMLLGAAAPARASAVQAADITGKWNLLFNTQDGPRPAQLTIKKDGDKLTGTIASDEGEVPVEASIKGSDVEIDFTYPASSGPIPIVMTGTVSGDSVKGSFAAGGSPAGDWSGTRTPAKDAKAGKPDGAKESKESAKLDVSGTWQFNVQTSAQSGTPTIVLKQNGETLTGEYQGQYGTAPLKGTIKGADLTFAFDLDIQGTSLHVVYAGTAEKDAMKGSVAYGDMAEGVFTARRK
ncbi:MAG: hypothetical protein DMF86_05875 [Acidobacteria bacterium]|nr:MAG: hypothetical protein DMF86_05875 [Acidobacteriota bacterium]